MSKILYGILVFTILTSCSARPIKNKLTSNFEPVVKIELTLSAFGVESDDFPSIDAEIDFQKKTSKCRKWYYNPIHKDSVYSLSQNELTQLSEILRNTNFEELKKEYTVGKTDQPTSTITIYTKKKKYKIKDYGLEGVEPLAEVYHIVYKY